MSDSSSSSGSESKMITGKDAEALMKNFKRNVREARELKESLKKGDVDFYTRYNGLVKRLCEDKIWFEQFCAKFPESNDAEEIQKLKEEAESEFDDLQQLMKKKQKEQVEEFEKKFKLNSREACELKKLLEKGDDAFQTRYNQLVERLGETKSSFANFYAMFPENVYARQIRAREKKEAQSEFDDLQQLKEKKEEGQAKVLKNNFQVIIRQGREIKELLEKGDDAFQSRYDQLRNYLDCDNSSFANFREMFPESNDAEEIQKLQEEAQSKFDDLTQLKTKKEEEQAEEFRTKIQSNIDDACEIKELLETGDDAFQSEYNQLVERLDDDKSSFANFRALFPESNHAAGIQKLQETAGSKFDDVTQLKEKEEPRSNLSLSVIRIDNCRIEFCCFRPSPHWFVITHQTPTQFQSKVQ